MAAAVTAAAVVEDVEVGTDGGQSNAIHGIRFKLIGDSPQIFLRSNNERGLAASSAPPFAGVDGVLQQYGAGHRAHPSGHRGDPAGAL